jgi:hypothetical protein
MPFSPPSCTTEATRQRFVTGLMKLTQNTTLALTLTEQELLACYVRGELSLEQVLTQLQEKVDKVTGGEAR